MDKLIINSNFTRGIITKLIKKLMKKKFGNNIDIQIEDLEISINDDIVKVRMSGEMSKESLATITKTLLKD